MPATATPTSRDPAAREALAVLEDVKGSVTVRFEALEKLRPYLNQKSIIRGIGLVLVDDKSCPPHLRQEMGKILSTEVIGDELKGMAAGYMSRAFAAGRLVASA